MSEVRFVKNRNIDGWPVRDTKEGMDMSKNDVIDALNVYEQQLSRTKAELEEVKNLLQVAFCPSQCDAGAIPRQVGDNEWEAEQCQFCHERETLLSNQQSEE